MPYFFEITGKPEGAGPNAPLLEATGTSWASDAREAIRQVQELAEAAFTDQLAALEPQLAQGGIPRPRRWSLRLVWHQVAES